MTGRKLTGMMILFAIAVAQSVWAQQNDDKPAKTFDPGTLDDAQVRDALKHASFLQLQAEFAERRKALGSQLANDSVKWSSFYRLDFVIREMDGKNVVNSQSYSLWVESSKRANIASGAEVPYSGSIARNVGSEISCTVESVNGSSTLKLEAALNINSNFPTEKDGSIVFRRIRVDVNTFLDLGKTTTVNITEDMSSRHQYHVDVTATKIKDIMNVRGQNWASGYGITEVGFCALDEEIYSPGFIVGDTVNGTAVRKRCERSGIWLIITEDEAFGRKPAKKE